MQNHGKNGIWCDFCGKEYKDKFKYYSAKFDMVEVDVAQQKQSIINVDRRFLDLDFCETCMKNLTDKIMETINKREKSASWTGKSQ